MLTSRYQSQHGIIAHGSALAPGQKTLAAAFREAGYRTGGFSANGLLSRRGFGRGYDRYRVFPSQRTSAAPQLWKPKRAHEINSAALSWLDEPRHGGRHPVFLHLHYMEPHLPYDPPESFLRRVFEGRTPPDPERISGIAFLAGGMEVDADTRRDIEAMYDAEVASLDADMRDLFAALERRRFLDDAVVVITSDHGEEFMEHRLMGHGKTLYNEVIRVPLIVLVPGGSRRVDVDDVVSLVDVAPTLLEWVGAPIPATFAGSSFAARLETAGAWLGSIRTLWSRGRGPIFSELIRDEKGDAKRQSAHVQAVISGPGKLIAGIGGEREVYDLARDPREAGEEKLSQAEQAALERGLAEFRERTGLVAGERLAPTPDDATREQMHALGYE